MKITRTLSVLLVAVLAPVVAWAAPVFNTGITILDITIEKLDPTIPAEQGLINVYGSDAVAWLNLSHPNVPNGCGLSFAPSMYIVAIPGLDTAIGKAALAAAITAKTQALPVSIKADVIPNMPSSWHTPCSLKFIKLD